MRPCVRGKVAGVGTCCGKNVCVQDPNDLTGDAGICVPAGAGGSRRPDLCYIGHAQTASDFCDATWVFCIDAVCSEPMWTDDGYQIAQCTCWEQEKAISWLPKGDTVGQGGAPCLMNYSAGKSMCDDMKNGALVSTFRPGRPGESDSRTPFPRTGHPGRDRGQVPRHSYCRTPDWKYELYPDTVVHDLPGHDAVGLLLGSKVPDLRGSRSRGVCG